jgi:hypothetical protein
MLPDKCGEHLHHGGVVFGGIAGDPLEGVDAADAHVDLLVAELLDGLGEAVSHLPFSGQGEVPSREQERARREQPGAREVRITPQDEDVSLPPGSERITEVVVTEITRQARPPG